jgi:hypothetical protein
VVPAFPTITDFHGAGEYLLTLINQARANPNFTASTLGQNVFPISVPVNQLPPSVPPNQHNPDRLDNPLGPIDPNEGLPAGTIDGNFKQPLAPNSVGVQNLRDEVNAYLTNFLLPNVADNPFPAGWPHNLNGSPRDRVGTVFNGMNGTPILSGNDIVEENVGETPPYLGARHVTSPQNLEEEVRTIFQYLFWDQVSSPDVNFGGTPVDPSQRRGHRQAFLNPALQEIGSSVIVGPFGNSDVVLTNNDFFAHPAPHDTAFITGVVYDDTIGPNTGQYDIGEGLQNVAITVEDPNTRAVLATATTDDAGGYEAQPALRPGTYLVMASGNPRISSTPKSATIGMDPSPANAGAMNKEVDFSNGPLVSVQDVAGIPTLTVDDGQDLFPATITCTNSGIQVDGSAPVSYNEAQAVTVIGGSAGNTFDVESTAAGVPLTIEPGLGGDTVNITPDSHNLGSIQGKVIVTGSSGQTSGPDNAGAVDLVIDDSANSATTTYRIGGGNSTLPFVQISGSAPIVYDRDTAVTSGVILKGGSGTDTFNVDAIDSTVPVTIATGAGMSAVNVAPVAPTIDGMENPLTVQGGPGTTFLTVNDQGSLLFGTASGYTVTRTSVVKSGSPARFFYTNIQGLTLNGGLLSGEGVVTYDVESTAAGVPVTIKTGDTSSHGHDVHDVVAIAPGTMDLTNLGADVTVVGAGATDVEINNQHNPQGKNTVVVTPSGMIIGDPVRVNYSDVEAVTYNGSVSGTYDVEGIARGTAVTVNAGTGPNTVTVAPGAVEEFTFNGPVTQPSPSPQPTPTPLPSSRPVAASLEKQLSGKKRKKVVKLVAEVLFSGGRPPLQVLSPFQQPNFQGVQVALHDLGGGVFNSLLFTARRGKHTFSRIVPI